MTKLLALLPAVILLAVPAHADVDTFIADLQKQGVPTIAPNGWPMLQPADAGNSVCDHLHSGETPNTVIGRFPPILSPWAPIIVAAAQRDICPDTL